VAVRRAIERRPHPARRRAVRDRAGAIDQCGGYVFQVVGAEAAVMAEVLALLTREGAVPEALRLAHLIGSAVVLGESGRRA